MIASALSITQWEQLLEKLYSTISSFDGVSSFIQEVDGTVFQFKFSDFPEFDFAESYCNGQVTPSFGTMQTPHITAMTTAQVFLDTISGELSLMEAIAEEEYEITGDIERLMKLGNILPFVIQAYELIDRSK